MAEFKVGQRVKVEFEGEISYVFSNNRKVQVRDDQGRTNSAYMEWVTHLDPADWPPQVGDIWEAEGREYYTRQNMACGGEIMVGNFDRPSQDYYQRDLADFKALNPVLVRRRGQ